MSANLGMAINDCRLDEEATRNDGAIKGSKGWRVSGDNDGLVWLEGKGTHHRYSRSSNSPPTETLPPDHETTKLSSRKPRKMSELVCRLSTLARVLRYRVRGCVSALALATSKARFPGGTTWRLQSPTSPPAGTSFQEGQPPRRT